MASATWDMGRYPSAIFALGRFQYGQLGFSPVLYLHSHRLHRIAVMPNVESAFLPCVSVLHIAGR